MVEKSTGGSASGGLGGVGKRDPRDIPNDPVNHPKHYRSHESGIECIEVTRHLTNDLGNCIKYVWCCYDKGNTEQDLRKAAWYARDEAARLESPEVPVQAYLLPAAVHTRLAIIARTETSPPTLQRVVQRLLALMQPLVTPRVLRELATCIDNEIALLPAPTEAPTP